MPLLCLSIAFLLGILLAAGLPMAAGAWLLFACASLFLLLFPSIRASWRRHRPPAATVSSTNAPHASRLTSPVSRIAQLITRLPLPLPLLLLFVFLGAARWSAAQPRFTPEFIAWYNGGRDTPGRPMVVEGVVARPPDARDDTVLLAVRAESIRPLDGEETVRVDGLLLARAWPGGDWRYGDRLRLEGQLETPTENEEFSYRDYLARQGIYAYMPYGRISRLARGQGNPLLAAIYAFRDRSLATIYRLFPDPEASLLAGILLGVESGIPAPVQEAFRKTGTAHVIAISGFNFSVLAGLFGSLFGRLLGSRRRFLAAGLSGVCIAVYAVLVGGSASVVRAALMGGLSLFAVQVGRRQDGLNSLAFVAALMALSNPQVLWDVGFQLSFTSTLGLILYAEPLSQWFIRLATRPRRGLGAMPLATSKRLAGPVGEYFLFTLAAQLLSLPVTLYYFRQLSLVAWVANPLILPAQPPVMVVGGLAVLLGMVFLPAGRVVGYLAWPFVAYTIRVVELFARVPGGSLSLGELSLPVIVAIYVLILGWTLLTPRFQRAASALSPSVALLGLGSLAVLVWQAAVSAPDGRLHVTVLDVGGEGRSGDAILVQTPSGRSLLVDGGPLPSLLSDGLGRRLPLSNRSLDFLVVAAGEEEQVGALPRVLERFPPRNVLWAGPAQGTYAARQLWEALNEAGLPVTPAETGQALDLGEGAWLRVVYAGERGAILLLEWRSFRLLLPIGFDFAALQALENGRSIGRVTALLLAESGYAPANPTEWIAALNPQLILLSVGAADRSGLPSPETLEAVQGYPLLRTDQNGWIHIETDGERIWVEVERQ